MDPYIHLLNCIKRLLGTIAWARFRASNSEHAALAQPRTLQSIEGVTEDGDNCL